jgi:uncharacterized protein (DUF924 family)
MNDERVDEERAQEAGWVSEVLSFWFDELDREAWFRKSAATDQAIRDRFARVHDRAASEPVEAAVTSPRRALAAVIVLDQFSRNMFRGTPQAFASDAKARGIPRGAVASGFDQVFGIHGRSFLYMPFEHSEDLADQDLAVALIGALGDDEYTRYALAHRDIIAGFGRFPHRNAVLGRVSTAEEAEFLRQPGSSF